jgi:hypothetical protein
VFRNRDGKLRGEASIDFHSDDPGTSLEQTKRERAQSWANFNHGIAGLNLGDFDDLAHRVGIDG